MDGEEKKHEKKSVSSKKKNPVVRKNSDPNLNVIFHAINHGHARQEEEEEEKEKEEEEVEKEEEEEVEEEEVEVSRKCKGTYCSTEDPTTNAGIQNGSSVGMLYTLHTHVWCQFACSIT